MVTKEKRAPIMGCDGGTKAADNISTSLVMLNPTPLVMLKF